MFWVQALTEVKVISVIFTIFYIYRGITISEVFLLGIVFSIVTILTEIPSSYLADIWGRKKVIITAVVFSLLYWVINIFAHSFGAFVLTMVLYAISCSFMSGTDEALVYDTSKELNLKNDSLSKLGLYFSSQKIFKIFTPLIAVLIAKNLTESRFIALLLIDVVANILALIASLFIIEPKHSYEVEKVEGGIYKDAIKLLFQSTVLRNIIFNRTIMFISIFILWRISSAYFVSIGIPVIILGVVTSSYHLLLFFSNKNVGKIARKLTVENRINTANYICSILFGFFLLNFIFIQNKYLALFIFSLITVVESYRWPLFSEIFNRMSKSYNRATTLSLTNFLKSILDIPLLFFSSWLIGYGYLFLFVFAFVLSLVVVVFFRLNQVETKT